MYIKLSAAQYIKSYHFLISPSNLLLLPFTACCTAPTSHYMVGEAYQTPCVTDEPAINENKIESASRPLVDFGVLNDILIKGLILCVKCLHMF
jgi:hypothetical protein